MTDDDRLTELFHSAASDAGAPPPRFDHQDVVAVSRRITARRRSAVIGGAVALLVVAGVGTVSALPRSDTSTTAAAAPADAAAAPEAVAGDAAGGAESKGGTAATAPGSNGSVVGGAAGTAAGPQPPGIGAPARPLGPGTTPCADRQDPALRALVVAVLPEAADAPGAATTDVCLPGAQRYLSLELGGGVLTVAYLPPGTVASLAPGASSASTASHGTVIVSPAPGYADRVPQLLQYLAPRL